MIPLKYKGKIQHRYMLDISEYPYRVFSKRKNGYMTTISKVNDTGRGDYPAVGITLDEKKANGQNRNTLAPIHVLVMESISTPPAPLGIPEDDWNITPESVKQYLATRRNGWEIDHIDHDKSNYHVENLEWVTSAENTQRAADFYLNQKNA